MKNLILSIVFIFTVFTVNAQDNEINDIDFKKNELKINMTNLIGFKWLDLGYERIINEESSFGVGTLFSLNSDWDTGLDEYRTFSITPYYRHFFSNKYARGFFVEVFGMIHSGKEEVYSYDSISNPNGSYDEKTFTDFAIGISAGGKFVSKKGFVAEIYLGIGRDLLSKSDNEIVGRGGITLGYRF